MNNKDQYVSMKQFSKDMTQEEYNNFFIKQNKLKIINKPLKRNGKVIDVFNLAKDGMNNINIKFN